eukprot:CAMPEP_0180677538 /NCGR_PEP_ID=MMETSP1037_2-20121125/67902_1 /TAXON_ID=632150 /ORGANISM="Azadinium spinosum, Strain 3D9" /LENGTH=70 /DNA_ID=CAMNT_0022707121 /DNA_START=49 /DNA_END=261 /DNA_ORIENTATION=-
MTKVESHPKAIAQRLHMALLHQHKCLAQRKAAVERGVKSGHSVDHLIVTSCKGDLNDKDMLANLAYISAA